MLCSCSMFFLCDMYFWMIPYTTSGSMTDNGLRNHISRRSAGFKTCSCILSSTSAAAQPSRRDCDDRPPRLECVEDAPQPPVLTQSPRLRPPITRLTRASRGCLIAAPAPDSLGIYTSLTRRDIFSWWISRQCWSLTSHLSSDYTNYDAHICATSVFLVTLFRSRRGGSCFTRR